MTADLKGDEALKQSLLQGQYATEEDILKAESYAREKNRDFSAALIDLKFLTKDLLGQVRAESMGVGFADMDSLASDRKLLNRIDEETAKSKRIIFMREDSVIVECASDTHPIPRDLAEKLFPGKNVVVRYTLPEYVDAALRRYDKPLSSRFDELFAGKASAPDIVGLIFEHAIDEKVSDIHFEPNIRDVVVRFRIDGVLLVVGRIPKPVYDRILNRVKVLAQLPIDEHMRTQDGSLRHERKEGVVNIRVSVAPTLGGEKMAMRLLSSYSGFSIDDLGLSKTDREMFDISSKKPFGMMLSVGPTGSGKTTTLYALLGTRNTAEVNVTTIEDPVEYRIEGLNQMQVNVATDLTFARGLRSIVRQDPDIVLVGEIRDRETAEIAVNAALTGRLLFSTFHSNDAATTIPRLLDMGIEPFLLSSTIELIVAQRLVRKICENCKSTVSVSAREIEKKYPVLEGRIADGDMTLFRGTGCNTCHQTGYRGRIGIFEMIKNTPELQDLIVTRPNRIAIWQLARTQGSKSLFEDGLEKVTEGVTSLEELLRVAQPDQIG